MAEDANNPKEATPSVDVAAIVKTVTEQVSKAVQTQIDQLASNVKVVADTLEKLPPAKAADAKDPGKAQPEPITAEKIAEIVNKTLSDRDAAAQAQAAKQGDRKKIVDKLVAEKLGGDADLAKFLPGDGDEASLTAAADALAGKLKTLKPDFGNASKDGGKTAAAGDGKVKQIPGLTEGQTKFAESLKLPA